MVDNPRLTIQQFSRGGNTEVPRIQDINIPSFTNVPSLSQAGSAGEIAKYQLEYQATQDAINVGSQVFDQSIQDIKNKQIIEAESAFGDILLQSQNQIQSIRNNADDNDDITELSLNAYDDVVEQVTGDKNFSTFQSQYLNNKLQNQRNNVGLSSISYQQQLNQLEAELDISKRTNSTAMVIFNEPKTFEANIQDYSAILDNIEGLPNVEKKQALERAKTVFADAAIRGSIAIDPVSAKQQIESGRFDKYVTPETKEQSLALVDRRITQEENKRRAELVPLKADLKLRIGRDPLSVTDAEIDSLRNQGVLSDLEAVDYKLSLDKQRGVEREIVNQELRVLGAMNGQVVLDFRNNEDKQAVDNYYEKYMEPQISKLNEDDVRTTISEFVGQVGIIPGKVKGKIIGALRSGTPEQMIASSRQLQSILTTNPHIENDFVAKDIAVADIINSSLDVGSTAEEAVDRVKQVTALENSGVLDYRRKQFKQDFSDETALSEATDAFDTFFSFEPDAEGPNFLQERLISDMKLLAGEYYDSNPDIDNAFNYAKDKIKRTWGVTNSDGKKRVMKYAPEAYYNNPILEDGWLESDLKGELKQLIPNVDMDNVYITVDSRTAKEAKKKNPTYPITIKNENGIFETLTDKEGNILRWQPDLQGAIKKVKEKKIKRIQKYKELGPKISKAIEDAITTPIPGMP